MTRALLAMIRTLALSSGLAAALWTGGLLWFVDRVDRMPEVAATDGSTQTDAVIVLTGGSERLAAGLDLLKQGKARKLFVSGVHQGVDLDRLLAKQDMPTDLRACCVTLGHVAADTVGNAEESKNWIEREHVRSLRLVTSNYHMLRSLLEFRRVMPDIEIIPSPVVPASVPLEHWWQRRGTAKLLVTEYSKYLLTLFRILAPA